MKRFIALLLAVSPAFAVATVSAIQFVGIGDSSVSVIFNSSAVFNMDRVRYGTSTCTSGSGGFVQIDGSVPEFSGGYPTFQMTVNLAGLLPSTLYYACPEVSTDGGVTWSSGVAATFTTLARTTTTPTAPTAVPTNFPAQTGTVRTVLSDCSNLQAQINAAVAGDTVSVPAGTICTGNYTTPTAPEAKTFSPSNVQTSNGQITITGHGYTQNEQVVLSAGQPNAQYLPGMHILSAPNNATGSNTDTALSPWHKGGKYWVNVVDSNNIQLLNASGGSVILPAYIAFTANTGASTISFAPTYQTPGGYGTSGTITSIPANTVEQLSCAPIGSCTLPGGLSLNTNYYLLSACSSTVQSACTTQLSATSGGSPITLTTTGSGTLYLTDQGSGTMYIMPNPPAMSTGGANILITSSGNLPPAGVRTSPAWDSQAFHFRQTVPQNAPGAEPELLQPGILAHNWIIRGAVFDTSTNTDYLTTTDPRPYCSIITTNQDTYNFIFDRSRAQGPGYPNRWGCSVAIFLEGTNVGFVNSDLEGMDYWHPWTTPNTLTGTFTSTTATIAAGTYHGGVFTMTTTGNTVVTVTSGGGVTGNIYVWVNMSGVLTVQPPTGVSVTCSTIGTTCNVLSAVASPTWPLDGNNRQAGGQIAIIGLTAGTVTSNCAYNCISDTYSQNNTEGSQSIIAGIGPGPYIFDNDYISGTGIPLHFDDSGGFLARGDYTITRNTFNVPQSQLAGGPQSNGLRYLHRNSIEWKGGQRAFVSGNMFIGSWSEDSPACVSIANTPRNGGYSTDFNISNNLIIGCGGMNPPYPINQVPQSWPAQRTLIQNNLALLNGWTYYLTNVGAPRGWFVEVGGGFEDTLIDHNTIYNNSGSTPEWVFNSSTPGGGVNLTNNIYFYTGDLQAIRTDTVQSVTTPGTNCTTVDAALAACMFNSLTLSDNVIVPSWAATQTQSGFVGTSTVTTAFPTGQQVPAGSTQPANVALVHWANPVNNTDFRLAGTSPYLASSTDGTQAGANIDVLNQNLSIISQARALSISSSGATITAYVPQPSVACYAGYGTSSDPTTWTWTAADTTASRQRGIAITGLSALTVYNYSIACSGTQAAPTQIFLTQ